MAVHDVATFHSIKNDLYITSSLKSPNFTLHDFREPTYCMENSQKGVRRNATLHNRSSLNHINTVPAKHLFVFAVMKE